MLTVSQNTREVARCILSHFSHVSIDRFHKLAFIIDHEHFTEEGEPLSDASYELVLDGCFSENLQKAAEDADLVEITTASLRSGDVKVFSVGSQLECELDENKQNSIRDVVREWGEVNEATINRRLNEIDLYRNADFESVIDFSD